MPQGLRSKGGDMVTERKYYLGYDIFGRVAKRYETISEVEYPNRTDMVWDGTITMANDIEITANIVFTEGLEMEGKYKAAVEAFNWIEVPRIIYKNFCNP